MYKNNLKKSKTEVISFSFFFVNFFRFWASKKHVQRFHLTTTTGGKLEHTCTRGNCGKRFGNSNVLESHLNVHDNNLLKCYFCQWAGPAGQVIQVKTHILRHLSAIGPYKCNFCTDRFFRKRHLIIHENNKHDIVEDRYRCENCDFKTYSQTSYYTHKRKCR